MIEVYDENTGELKNKIPILQYISVYHNIYVTFCCFSMAGTGTCCISYFAGFPLHGAGNPDNLLPVLYGPGPNHTKGLSTDKRIYGRQSGCTD